MSKYVWRVACVCVLLPGLCSSASVRLMGCSEQNYCNGHGKCRSPSQGTPSAVCECMESWGAPTDPVQPSADCSLRTCPMGIASADLPSSATEAHHQAECSNAGICDRESGSCDCMIHRAGRACEIMLCPHDCSGHGMCTQMKDLPKLQGALPLSNKSLAATTCITSIKAQYL